MELEEEKLVYRNNMSDIETYNMLRESEGQKTCWMKFEDWMWYNNHQVFEFQTSLYSSCCSRPVVRIVRTFLLILSTCQIALGIYVRLDNPISILADLAYLTTWGKYLTFFTVLISNFVTQPTLPQFNALEEYDPIFTVKKYTIFRAWKWFAILYELSLITEIVITVYFWAVIFALFIVQTVPTDTLEPEEKTAYAADHILPLFILLVDYMMN